MSQGFSKGVPIDTDGLMSSNSQFVVPSQSAVRAYVQSYQGAANNAAYLGGVQAANYVVNSDSRILSGNLTFTASNVSFTTGFFAGNATVNSVMFANTGYIATEGMLSWNSDESTLNLGLTGNVSVLQVGQEVLYRVKNQTGVTIPNGTVVMANGTLGSSGRILVTPAIANGSVPSQYIMGIATEDILDGADGYVTHFGKVRGIDTSMFVDGDVLYANPAVPGGLTKTKPVAPNSKTIVALVIHAHTNGVLFVRPTFGSNINDDENVEITSIANNDMLVYRAANGRFENTRDLNLSSIAMGTGVSINSSAFTGNVVATTVSGNLTGNVVATTISGNLTGNVSATTVSASANVTVGANVLINTSTIQVGNSIINSTTLTGNVIATTISGNLTGNVVATTISGNLTGNVIATTISGNLTGNVVATTISGNLTGNVTATTISGNLTGNVLATTINASSYTIGADFTANSTQVVTPDLLVTGNLIVNGTFVSLNVATLDVEDLNITVAKGTPSAAAANGAGLTVDGANATLLYISAGNTWLSNVNFGIGNSTTNVSVNSTAFIGNVIATSISGNLTGNVTATTISGNLTGNVAATTLSGNLTGNVVATTISGNLTGNVAATTISGNLTGNVTATFVSASYANVSGQVNTSTLYSSGNVGIGINPAAFQLHIKATSPTDTKVQLENSGGANVTIQAETSVGDIGTTSAHPFQIFANNGSGANRILVAPGGNVHIGSALVTHVPTSTLQVNGTVGATSLTGNLTGNVVATTITGNLTGNVAATTISGNLTGNVLATTVNATTINATSSLVVGSSMLMNTTIIQVGNSTVKTTINTTAFAGDVVATSITGNLTGNVIATTISGNLTGNVVATTISGNLTAITANVTNKIQVGTPNAFDFGSNAVLEVDGNGNTYVQIVHQNANTGNNASTDLVLTNDAGNDSVGFIDLGINGSNYNQPGFNITGAGDAYLYASNGQLAIGTASAAAIVFHAGGTTTSDRKMTINTTAVSVGNSTSNVVINATAFVGNVVATTISGNLTGNVAATTITGNLTGNVVATTISGNLTGNVTATTISGNLTGNVAATTVTVGANVLLTTANLAIGNSTANVYVNSTAFVGNTAGVHTGNVSATILAAGNTTITGFANIIATSSQIGSFKVATNSGTPANDPGILSYLISSANADQRVSRLYWDPNGADAVGGDYFNISAYGNSQVDITNQSGGPITFATTGSERMRITATGNVGIGNISPTHMLSVYGTSIFGNTLTIQTSTNNTPNATWGGQLTIGGSGYSGGIALDGEGLWVGHNSTGRSIIFATDETERVRISNTGNVGIGNSAPTDALSVTGNAYFSGLMGIGTAINNAYSLSIARTFTLDSAMYGIVNQYIDSNTAVTAARGRFSQYNSVINQSLNRSADGLTTYLGTYYGIQADVYNANSAGGNAFAQALNGGYFRALNYATANAVAANAANFARGLYGETSQLGPGIIGDATGVLGRVSIGNNSVTGNITAAYGVYSQIVSNTAATIGTGTLYYGAHSGGTTTLAWGMFITGEDKNYFSGNTGIGNTAPTDKLSVNGSTYVGGNLTILSTGALIANGSAGAASHVLHSNGTAIYWAADDAGVTSVASGNGITGGTITSTGTLSVVAGTGTVVNTTGVHVNATYIGTLSANNAAYLGGTAAASYAKLASPTFSGTASFAAATFSTILGAGNVAGALIRGPQTLTAASGTYTTPAGCTRIHVQMVGGGGAGGGMLSSSTGGASGGGAGGYLEVFAVVTESTGYSYTVGAAGAGVSGANGGGGGNTTLVIGATTYTAAGGAGGVAGGGVGGAGGSTTNGTINMGGDDGGSTSSGAYYAGGKGGASFYGGGGSGAAGSGNGNAGSAKGAGGGGASASASGTARTGGAGVAGLIRIWEYAF